MATYYWSYNGGGTGWATTSGGVPPFPAINPTELDDIVFDSGSTGGPFSSTVNARTCTITAGTNMQIIGTFYLTGSFLNSSTVVELADLSLVFQGKTGTWSITTQNRPLANLQADPYDATQLPTYNLGTAITINDSFFGLRITNVNFNTQNFAVTGPAYFYSDNLYFATTINLGSSTFSSKSNTTDSFTLQSANAGGYRYTVNLGTSKINNYSSSIDVSYNTIITASAGQAFTNLYSCNISVYGNLSVTTGTISASQIGISVNNTSASIFGALVVTSSTPSSISASGTGTTTIGTINGNVSNPASLTITNNETQTLIIGAIGGVFANSISGIELNQYGTSIQISGLIRITGLLDIYTSPATTTTITGAVTAGLIEIFNVGNSIVNFSSTTTTSTSGINIIGDSGSSTRFVGAIASNNNFDIFGPVTISSTVTCAGPLVVNSGTVTFPAAVTANTVSISGDSTTFSSGTHNIADSFQWYTGNLALGSSTLIVKRYLSLTGFYPFNAGTSTVRVGEYVGDAGQISTGGSQNVFNVLQLRGDAISVSGALAAATLSRTGNTNNYGETVFDSNVTVTGTGAGALTITGNSAINRMLVKSATTNSPITITATARTLANVDFKDITAAGGTWTGTSLGDCLGNSGITFTPAVVRYVRSSGTWANTAIWSANSGGVGGATIPLAQDAVIINNLSGNTAITVGNVRILGANITVTSDYQGTINFNGNTTSGGAITKSSVYGILNIQQSNVVITSDGNTAIEFCNRITPMSLNYGNNANTVVNTRIDVGNNTVTLASALGSPSNRNNKLILSSGTFSTGNYDMYLGEINGTTYSLGSPQLNLTNSNVYVYDNFIRCNNINSGNSNVYAVNLTEITAYNGGFYNLYISNTDTIKVVTLTATIDNQVSSNHPQYPSTANFELNYGNIRVKNLFDIGSLSARATLNNVTIYNDTFVNFQTSYASYNSCDLLGATNGITAFGLADLGNNTGNFEFPSVIKAYAFSNSAAQSFTLPDDFTGSAILIAYGGGGAGGASFSGGSAGRGGGSGATAKSEVITLSRGQTVYISSTEYTPGVTSRSTRNNGRTTWINIQSNSAPTSEEQGVSAQGGFGATGSTTGTGTGGTVGIGKYVTSGKNGAYFSTSIGGGGASITNAAAVGSGAQFSGGGVASNGTSANLTANSTPGLNGTEGTGQGGGYGGSGYFANITSTGTYLRATTDITLTMFSTAHGLTNGSYPITVSTTQTGTYSRTSGNANVVVTRTDHGLTSNDIVYLDFTSGTAADGYYTVIVASTSQFRVVTGSTSGTTGSVRILPFPSGANLAVTVISPDQYTVTTTSTGPVAGNVSVTYGSPIRDASAGGNGANSSLVEITYLNGEYQGLPTPAIGPGGGGGGGGGRSTSNSLSVGGAGGQGGIGAGGGGSGQTGTTAVSSGAGGPGLVLIVYAYGRPSSFGLIQY